MEQRKLTKSDDSEMLALYRAMGMVPQRHVLEKKL